MNHSHYSPIWFHSKQGVTYQHPKARMQAKSQGLQFWHKPHILDVPGALVRVVRSDLSVHLRVQPNTCVGPLILASALTLTPESEEEKPTREHSKNKPQSQERKPPHWWFFRWYRSQGQSSKDRMTPWSHQRSTKTEQKEKNNEFSHVPAQIVNAASWKLTQRSTITTSCSRHVRMINLDILPTHEQLHWQWAHERATPARATVPRLVETEVLTWSSDLKFVGSGAG